MFPGPPNPRPRVARRLLPAAVLLALACLIAGCHDSPAASGTLPTVSMAVGSKTYTLEVATTDGQRDHGLMERDALPQDHGMIFVFPEADERKFWMYHTRFPLDIIYLDADGKVVSIKQMKAYDHTGIPSDGPAMYAIELNLGQAAGTGLRKGSQVTIPNSLKPGAPPGARDGTATGP